MAYKLDGAIIELTKGKKVIANGLVYLDFGVRYEETDKDGNQFSVVIPFTSIERILTPRTPV